MANPQESTPSSSRTALPARLGVGAAEVDLERGIVFRDGTSEHLPRLELRLLIYFLHRPGELLSRRLLLSEVWHYNRTPNSRTVDVHVASLRRKLEHDAARPRVIETVYGKGYRLVPSARDSAR